jgi:hypothetical protein
MALIEQFKCSKYYSLNSLLHVLVVLNGLFLLKILYYVLFLHHLPPPFYYDANNTFFDFFEISRMSFMSGLYENTSPNYLPFVFGLGRLFSPLSCDLTNPYNFRICALPSALWVTFFYVLAAILLGRYLRQNHLNKAKLTTILKIDFILLTSPMLLYALERGNYIILTLLLLVIYEFTKVFCVRIIWRFFYCL